MIVLGVDPGKTTGLALWEHSRLTAQWQAETWEAMTWCDGWLASHGRLGVPILVACERFNVTTATITKGADAHWAIGQGYVLDFLCRKHNHVFEYQGASDAKKMASNARLKHLGWYASTPGGHANDAARHVLLALARHGETSIFDSLV